MRLSLLLLAFGFWPLALPAAPETASDLARRLQAHYDTVKDFTADFTHAYKGGVLKQSATERGKVKIKKPGRMYWTYSEPDKKEFVSDGTKVFFYLVADKAVYVNDLPKGDEAPTALLFLTGRGNLTRDFRAAIPGTAPPAGVLELDLTPTASQSEFTFLTLRVDARTLVLRGMSYTDPQGGLHTMTFSNLKENVGLADTQFVFKIPKDAEVQ